MTKFSILVLLALCCFPAHAESVTLICIWNVSEGKRQSYIVDFDQAANKVTFNGEPATDPEVSDRQIKFSLHFKDVVWPHTIDRTNGVMVVDKTDSHDSRRLQCGKLGTGAF